MSSIILVSISGPPLNSQTVPKDERSTSKASTKRQTLASNNVLNYFSSVETPHMSVYPRIQSHANWVKGDERFEGAVRNLPSPIHTFSLLLKMNYSCKWNQTYVSQPKNHKVIIIVLSIRTFQKTNSKFSSRKTRSSQIVLSCIIQALKRENIYAKLMTFIFNLVFWSFFVFSFWIIFTILKWCLVENVWAHWIS